MSSSFRYLSPALEAIDSFEANNFVWAVVIAVLIIALGALRIMKIANDYNLYSRATHLPAIIYALPFVAFLSPDDIIAPSVVGFIMTSALEGLFGGYNHFSGGAKIFRGCFWLGVFPLIYPSMLIFAILLIGVALVLDRGGRDLILIPLGFVIPSAIYIYIWWLCGVMPAECFDRMCDAFLTSEWDIKEEWSILIQALLFIGFAIFSIARIDEISIALVARTRLTFTALVVVVGGLLFFVPSFDTPQLAVLSAPIALTLTAAFYELPVLYATISYITIVFLTLLSHVLP